MESPRKRIFLEGRANLSSHEAASSGVWANAAAAAKTAQKHINLFIFSPCFRMLRKPQNLSQAQGFPAEVLFRSPGSKTEHYTVRLRLKTSTKTILSTTSTTHYNSRINNHDLVKYYQIPSRAVNGEIATTVRTKKTNPTIANTQRTVI